MMPTSDSLGELGLREFKVTVRPPRAVVLYPGDEHWIYHARRAIESISRIWGGAGFVLAPVGRDGNLDRRLLPLLRRYDPDLLVLHTPTFQDLARLEPQLVSARAAERGISVAEFLETRLTEEGSEPDLSFETMDQIGEWFLAPLRTRFEFSSLNPDQYPDLPLTQVSVADRSASVVETSGLTNDLALLVESHLGRARSTTKDRTVQIVGNDALAGAMYRMASKIASPRRRASHASQIEIEARAPFRTTERGLTWTTINHHGIDALVAVVGDTAQDHSLAMICDRVIGGGVWLPSHLAITSEGENQLGASLLELAYEFMSGPKLLVTSASLELEQLSDLVGEVESRIALRASHDQVLSLKRRLGTGGPVMPLPPSRLAEVACEVSLVVDGVTDLPLSRLAKIAPDGAVEPAQPLDVPELSTLGDVEHWQIDVLLGGHVLPSSLNRPDVLWDAEVDVGRRRNASLRVTRHGAISHAPSPTGLGDDAAASRADFATTRLRFPGAFEVFSYLASESGLEARLSDKGRLAMIAIEQWSGIRELASDLVGAPRALLDAMVRPKPKGQKHDHIAISVGGEWLVSFEHAARATSLGESEVRGILDRLLAAKVLRRGLVLSCERCRRPAFYSIERLAEEFRCSRCARDNRLSQPRWREPITEPRFYYDLDPVVRDFLTQNGDLPVLASVAVAREARSFLYAPEIELRRGGGNYKELDICSVVDGRTYVGEAKSGNSLGDSRKTTKHAAAGLVEASFALRADVVVVATADDHWNANDLDVVQESIRRRSHNLSRPRPEVCVVTNLRSLQPSIRYSEW